MTTVAPTGVFGSANDLAQTHTSVSQASQQLGPGNGPSGALVLPFQFASANNEDQNNINQSVPTQSLQEQRSDEKTAEKQQSNSNKADKIDQLKFATPSQQMNNSEIADMMQNYIIPKRIDSAEIDTSNTGIAQTDNQGNLQKSEVIGTVGSTMVVPAQEDHVGDIPHTKEEVDKIIQKSKVNVLQDEQATTTQATTTAAQTNTTQSSGDTATTTTSTEGTTTAAMVSPEINSLLNDGKKVLAE